MNDPLQPRPITDDHGHMYVMTINCTIGSHDGCPESNETMRCICDCHKDNR